MVKRRWVVTFRGKNGISNNQRALESSHTSFRSDSRCVMSSWQIDREASVSRDLSGQERCQRQRARCLASVLPQEESSPRLTMNYEFVTTCWWHMSRDRLGQEFAAVIFWRFVGAAHQHKCVTVVRKKRRDPSAQELAPNLCLWVIFLEDKPRLSQLGLLELPRMVTLCDAVFY